MIIVGPSAAGKTELVKALLANIPSSTRLITTTTRPRRLDETNEYDFVSTEEFEKGIERGDFFEYAEVYGNLYGSSKKMLDEQLAKFKYVFAIIDVKGATVLKSKLKEAKIIFLRPGSLEEIQKRIIKTRNDVSKEELQQRLDLAAHELSLASTFDAVVDNKEGHFEETVKKVMGLL